MKAALRTTVALWAGWLALAGVAGAPQADKAKPDAAKIDVARRYFKALRDGKYDQCLNMSDATMRSALPVPKLKTVWEGTTQAFGAYEGEIRATTQKTGAFTVVSLVSRFKSGSLLVQVTVDKEGNVAGLFFRPSSEGVDYEAPPYVDRSRFREEEVTIGGGEFPLPGTLTLPRTGEPFSAVVLVHGSGPHDQDETVFKSKPFRDLAWGLASRGIAVLRYEKRTHKYGTTMNPVEITIDTETADDAVFAARLLMDREDIRTARVYVVGHSLGATAAPYIGKKAPDIAGLIMIAPAARPIYDLVEDQIVYLAKLTPQQDDASKQRIEKIRQDIKKLRDGTYKPGDTLLGAPAEYWANLNVMEPVKNAKTYKNPILIIQGGRDYQVSMKDFAIWKKELAGRAGVTLKLFDKFDHLMQSGEGPSSPEQYQRGGHVDVEVIKTIADWITAQH